MDSNKRYKRHQSSRAKVAGSEQRPRVSVHRSARYIYAQVVNDAEGKTIAAVHSKEIKGKGKVEQARMVGETLAKLLKAKGVGQVVFDRSGYRYHGRVQAVVDGLRGGGLEV